MPKTIGKTILSPFSFGSICSYELCGNRLIARLFGLLPVRTIHLTDVHYLRLATRDEVTPTYLLFNWSQFLPHRRSVCPVYILQTKKHQRVFLKLEGAAHFRLRQAIGRSTKRDHRLAA